MTNRLDQNHRCHAATVSHRSEADRFSDLFDQKNEQQSEKLHDDRPQQLGGSGRAFWQERRADLQATISDRPTYQPTERRQENVDLLEQRIEARLKARSEAKDRASSEADGLPQPKIGSVSDNTITNHGEPTVPHQPREGNTMAEEISTTGDQADITGSDGNQEALEQRFQNLYLHLMEKQVSFKEAVEPYKTDNQSAGKG